MRTLNDYFLTVELDDISTAGQKYVVAPDNGKIIKFFSVINGAIGTADATLTAKINGTAVTNGTLTVAYSGSAAGDMDSATPSAANELLEGDVIEIETDGASTNTVPAVVTFVVRR